MGACLFGGPILDEVFWRRRLGMLRDALRGGEVFVGMIFHRPCSERVWGAVEPDFLIFKGAWKWR